jgi:hypothetical protein
MVDPSSNDITQSAGDAQESPGGVRRDVQGNVVWEWNPAAGTTSRLLQRLEVPGLKLLDEERPAASQPPVQRELAQAREQGFDPYGGRAATPGPSVARIPSRPATPEAPLRKPSLLARLFGRR